MLAPISWLKKYVDITLSSEELAARLTEVGLNCEKMQKVKDDLILDIEVTPNRPDCLSIIGVTREIAAIENEKIKYPKLKTDLKPNGKTLPLTIHTNYKVTPRLTGIVINKVSVKESPKWLEDRLESIGQRPINNIVDITNFVMYELGNPIHSFDYHKISNHEFWIKQAKGGEEFESVDEIKYHLPKGAIIYEDKEKIFDLVGIKGGKNSGTYEDTKAVFIAVEVDDPVLIRKTSQTLGLRSDASSIFERGVNKGGTVDALKRVTDLILELAGGEIASKLYDLKEREFEPWKLDLRLDRLEYILGIKISEREVASLLDRLNLNPVILASGARPESKKRRSWTSSPRYRLGEAGRDDILTIVECTIPTYRNDLQIEEDLIEEVARLYGYNNFSKTLPIGEIPTITIPYFKDYKEEEKVKNILTASGFSEIYSYSLISESDLEPAGINPDNLLRIDNPVSREFEYLRPNLKINLLKAIQQNKAFSSDINLFELGKVYKGKHLKEIKEEYHLAGISNTKNFAEVKGIVEKILEVLSMYYSSSDPAQAGESRSKDLSSRPRHSGARTIIDSISESIEVLDEGIYFELNYSELLKKPSASKIYQPISKYPPVIEDISLVIPSNIKVGDIINEMKKQSSLIAEINLIDQYETTKTFRIVYLNRERNLTHEEVEKIREKIARNLEKKLDIQIKT